MRSSVFFLWGGLCTCAFIYAYFLVPETKVRSSLSQTMNLKQSLTNFPGSVPRASRQDDGGDYPSHVGQVASHPDFCLGEGYVNWWQDECRCYRRCREEGKHVLRACSLSLGQHRCKGVFIAYGKSYLNLYKVVKSM